MEHISRLQAALDEMISGEQLADDPERGAKRLLAELTGTQRGLLESAMRVLEERAENGAIGLPRALTLNDATADRMAVELFRWGRKEFIPFHGHGNGVSTVQIARGGLTEHVAHRRDPSAAWNGADVEIVTRDLREGEPGTHPVPHVHYVTNNGTETAFSLHVTAPKTDGGLFFFQGGKLRQVDMQEME
jgi:hypothetical protein